MGTNFFWSAPDMQVPPVSEEAEYGLHIGKRSGAGNGLCSFSLQGHREFLDGSITTWDQWKRIILMGGTVIDEYGRTHEPMAFVAEVESTTVENRRRQYDWIRDRQDEPWFGGVIPEGITPPLDTNDEWLCPDGFSFTFREFS